MKVYLDTFTLAPVWHERLETIASEDDVRNGKICLMARSSFNSEPTADDLSKHKEDHYDIMRKHGQKPEDCTQEVWRSFKETDNE